MRKAFDTLARARKTKKHIKAKLGGRTNGYIDELAINNKST